MEQRFLHGNVFPEDIANAIVVNFNQNNLEAQKFQFGNQTIVQIRSRQYRKSGGNTALSVVFQPIEDGVSVNIGQQSWFGIMASLGVSAISTLLNPAQIVDRLDDIAQDIENLQLNETIWDFIQRYARNMGAGFELSERLRTITCDYCLSANSFGVSNCIACGAPLGKQLPRICGNCGYVMAQNILKCTNCGSKYV